MLSGLKDVDREILKHVDDGDLIRICSIDKKTWNEVCDDVFLRRRLSRYPDIEKYKLPNESFKEFFLRVIYYTAKMRELYKFEYKSGDFKEQYDLLKKNFINLGDKILINYNELFSESVLQGFFDLAKYAIQKRVSFHRIGLALEQAARRGNFEIVKWLVENGANVHYDKDSALIGASEQGHLDIAKFLLENGADINAQSGDALGRASKNGHLEMVKLLVGSGADIHAYDDYALRMAAGKGHLPVVKYLVEHGADVNVMGGEPLIQAAYNRKLSVLKYLVRQGADPHAKKDTALKLAEKNAHTEISEYLRSF